MSNVSNTPPQQVNLQVRYDDMNARYANQVLLNSTAEECYLDFSPGVVMNGPNGGAVLPIHTRIVMTPAGMLRLYQAIGQALQNYQVVAAPAPETPTALGGGEGKSGSSES